MAIVDHQLMTEYQTFLNAREDVESSGYVSLLNNRHFAETMAVKKLTEPLSSVPRLGLKSEYGARRLIPPPPFLTDRAMRRLIESDQLIILPSLGPDQIREATLELRTGPIVFQSKYDLPTKNHVKEHATQVPLNIEYVLEPGPKNHYFIESYEEIRLPDGWEGLTHTKSTCGRVGCMCQALDEKYAHIRGVKGGGKPEHIMMSVKPLAFPILIKPRKTRMFQIKISQKGSSYLSREDIEKVYGQDVALFDSKGDIIPVEDVLEKNGLKLTLNTKKAFVSKKGVKEPIDLTKKEHYDPHEYFELIESNNNGELKMGPNRLYLCSSNETLKIGNKIGVLNREDPHIGPGLWTQFAGFIAPGFEGNITFEMWSFFDRIVTQGSPIAKFFLEELDGKVENNYSTKGYYKDQSGPKLAKVFKPWD